MSSTRPSIPPVTTLPAPDSTLDLDITLLSAFSDNYIWLIRQARQGWVVDPGDARPVQDWLHKQNLGLAGILVTHHHPDHQGGVQTLRQHYGCPAWGPANDRIAELDHIVGDLDRITLAPGLSLQVLAVPGHTLDHIAFVLTLPGCPNAPWLFCGDTLFSAGCGRLFEGSPAQMWHSLQRLSALPDDTWVCCAHEYTEANLRFAAVVEPDNPARTHYQQQVQACRQRGEPSLPSTLAREKAINPFLRPQSTSLQASLRQHQPELDINCKDIDIFTAVRRFKDGFNG